MGNRAILKALALCAILLSSVDDVLAAWSIVAVPPAEYRAQSVQSKAAPALLLGAVAPTHRIALPAPALDESAVMRTQSAPAGANKPKAFKGGPLAIGFGRDLPAEARNVSLEDLRWVSTADGGRAARIEVVSPGAAAVRVGLQLNASDPDLTMRFSGSGIRAEVFGPIVANVIADATGRGEIYWTPVLVGEKAILELHAVAGADLSGTVLRLVRVSHLAVDGAAPRHPDAKASGFAGACEIDVACRPRSAALDDVANAVGMMVFSQDDGVSYLCTGTLLNDSITSFTPYLLTANHCINSAKAAASINVYWFYRAGACGSLDDPPYALQTAGAMLLARSEDWDWALVRMFDAPPAGVRFSAWRAETVAASSSAISVHHPEGDFAKWSLGTTFGYQLFTDGSSFVKMLWSEGVTEAGSSGAGLFTFLPSGGYYELRGGLLGGDSSCSNPTGLDYYSRLDNMLPLVGQYLTPNAVDGKDRVVVVEYYNASLDHYFITASADEINKLDTGFFKGWVRTGFRFLAYAGQSVGANPVCRFYMRPEVGDSHFYSGDPFECVETQRKYANAWIYESPSVFFIPLPNASTGACPVGTRPIWRFFNTIATNHRYTAEVAVRDALRRTAGWVAEGYGPDQVIMCSPDGS